MTTVDFYAKTFPILYPCLENSTTGNAISSTLLFISHCLWVACINTYHKVTNSSTSLIIAVPLNRNGALWSDFALKEVFSMVYGIINLRYFIFFFYFSFSKITLLKKNSLLPQPKYINRMNYIHWYEINGVCKFTILDVLPASKKIKTNSSC